MKWVLGLGGFGFTLGLALSGLGFTDYGEVQKMFLFQDLRLFLTFIGAVGLTGIGFAVLGKGKFPAPGKVDKNQVVGGVIFGAGWALTGACPSIPLVQIGEGKLWAVITLVGVVSGILLHGWLKRHTKEALKLVNPAGSGVRG